MTKEVFIKKIREHNKNYRQVIGNKCEGIYINSIYFRYEHIRLCFDDDDGLLYIFLRNQNKIIAGVSYTDLIIGFNN